MTILLILEVMLIIHAVRTGRASPWAFIILFAPLIGAIAYVIAVLIPDWFGSPQGRRAQRRVANSLNPEKRYRELFSARLMQVRHQLGLPLVETEPVTQLSDSQRPIYEKAAQDAASHRLL